MANEVKTPIPARLKNVAVGGHVAGAADIIDDTLNKDQATINSEVQEALGTGGSVDEKIASAVNTEKTRAQGAEEAIDGRVDSLESAVGTGGSVDSRIASAVATETTRAQAAESALNSGKADKATTLAGYGITDAYTKSETYTKTEVNGLVDTPHQEYVTVDAYASLPATGSKDTIYRVSNYNGSTSQVDASVYSEYAWNGTQYIFLCVKSQIGEVFDISVYNNNAKYTDLADALGTNGEHVPQSLRKGGMSVKFVLTSDNKYVQFRYTGTSTAAADFTKVANWQKEDFDEKLDKIYSANIVNPAKLEFSKYISPDGYILSGEPEFCVSDYIPVIIDGEGKDVISNAEEASFDRAWIAYDSNKVRTRWASNGEVQYSYQEGDAFIRLCFCINSERPIACANYRTELIEIPYSEYAPVVELSKAVNSEIERIDYSISDIKNNLKDPKRNLIDRTKIITSALLGSSGNILTGYTGYGITDYIPVFGNDIVCSGFSATPWRLGIVYDKDKNMVRAMPSETIQYHYQEGDYYVRFNLAGISDISTYTGRAFFGTELYPFTPYDNSDYTEIKKIEELEDSKLDKEQTVNLVDPSKLEWGKTFNSSGDLWTGVDESIYCITDYIKVNGQNISSNAAKESFIAGCVVYGQNKEKIRFYKNDNKYEYQSGDFYVRFAFNNESRAKFANNGDELVEIPYSDYKPLAELEVRVDKLEAGEKSKDYVVAATPNCLYSVYNSMVINRQIISRLFMSHLFNVNDYQNSDIFFSNYCRNLPIIPTSVSVKSETDTTINIVPKTIYINKSFVTKIRISDAAASKSITPKILVIGDSVTDGYGADSNKEQSWFPTQYCAWAKYFFELDKIDGGDNASEYNAILLGGVYERNYDFTIHYNGIERVVRAKAQGQGGAQLNELFDSKWGVNYTNPFYDTLNNTFSILSYISNYRTMDDLGVRLVSNSADPHGETVTGSDGQTYTIGQMITSQTLLSSIDVCTPTHIVINLNHNTSNQNFRTYAPQVISTIQTELPSTKIIFMVIDETGTYFPCDYPNYDSSMLDLGDLHKKNLSIYNYIRENLEDESNNIYLLGAMFIQPTAEAFPTIHVDYSEYVARADEKTSVFNIKNPQISGPKYHPNNICHEALGYQLYAMIKYLIC